MDTRERPVARMQVRMFDNFKGSFYLYPGINFVGRDAHSVQVFMPHYFISRHHLEIECREKGPLWVKDLPKSRGQPSSRINGSDMRREAWYELLPGRELVLGGLVHCFIEELSADEQKNGPSKSEVNPIIQKYRAERFASIISDRTPDPESLASHNRPRSTVLQEAANQEAEEFVEESSIPCTLPMADVTQRLEDDTSDYGSNTDGEIQATIPWGPQPTIMMPKPRTKPPPVTSSEPLDQTFPLARSFDCSTDAFFDNDVPTQLIDDHEVAAPPHIFSPRPCDPDAPTQVLSFHSDTILPPELTSASISRSAGPLDAGHEFVPNTQISEHPTSCIGEPRDRAAKELDPVDTDHDRVPATQSTQQDEDTAGAKVSFDSPGQSPEPEPAASPEVSQVRSSASFEPTLLLPDILQFQDVVQSTPVHLHGKFPENSESEEKQRAQEQADADDVEKVPQTPEDKHPTGMSDVSTQEMAVHSAPLGDSSEGDVIQPADALISEDQQLKDLGFSSPHTTSTTSAVSKEAGEFQSSRDDPASISVAQAHIHSGAIESDKPVDEIIDQDSDGDVPMIPRRTRRSRPIMKDSQETSSSFSRTDSPSTDYEGSSVTTSVTRSVSRQSSRISTRKKEGSPKHGMGADARAESPPKPSKLIKTESTEETIASASSMRLTPGRLLRKSTSDRSMLDMEPHKPVVMISAPKMTDAEKKRLRTLIERLGGTYRDDKGSYKEATVLIFQGTSRTWKLMCAIVRCIPIVTMNWLTESSNSNRFLPYGSFLFDGLDMENDSGVSLAESCRRAQERLGRNDPLFQGLLFYFITHKAKGKQTNKGIVITANLIKDTITPMVAVCSGKICKGEPKEVDKENVVIIGSDFCNDEALPYVNKGFHVMRLEFILGSILRQEVDFTKYGKLCESNTPKVAVH
ncbi:Mediator of DNA damage checkpoint protein 1 [Mortierella alpina]|nr:Mediator of DNA damage checkpoint protein 1 [Mortierella alpina]